jgi:hypothetical protein
MLKVITTQFPLLLFESTASCQIRQDRFGKIETDYSEAYIQANTSPARATWRSTTFALPQIHRQGPSSF